MNINNYKIYHRCLLGIKMKSTCDLANPIQKCKMCGISYSLIAEFWHRSNRHLSGFKPECRNCRNEEGKKYAKVYNQREDIKKSRSDYNKFYHLSHRDNELRRNAIYLKTDMGRAALRRGRVKSNIKRRENIELRLHHIFGNELRKQLKRFGLKKKTSTFSILGYTREELREHLESKFMPGMTWDNYGKGKDRWNIDHKIPKSSFHFTSIEDPEFKKCWGLENLQPMWEPENLKKHNKLDWDNGDSNPMQ